MRISADQRKKENSLVITGTARYKATLENEDNNDGNPRTSLREAISGFDLHVTQLVDQRKSSL